MGSCICGLLSKGGSKEPYLGEAPRHIKKKLLNSQTPISNWSTRRVPSHQMMFEIVTHTTPQKIPL